MTTASLAGLATLLLVVGTARGVRGAPQHTKNLHLRLGPDAYENQNWQRLDLAVCPKPGDPTLCVTGGPANLIQAPTAPFACAATTGGLYTDTDCNQLCRCNPAQAAWCRSDTGACGSATNCCGPTTTTTTTTVVTTTTTLPPAPSWVPFTIGAWMLDESTPGQRINAQGTTARNLSESAPVPNDTVNKMEGLAAAHPATTSYLFTADTTIQGLAPPFTCLLWARFTGTDTGQYPAVIRTGVSPGSDGIKIGYDNHNKIFFTQASPGVVNGTPSVPFNTWAHVAVTDTGTTLALYQNGASVGTAAVSGYTPGIQFQVGASDNGGFPGQLDEAACATAAWPPTSICRVCSCGLRGEQCSCSGTAYGSTGRNATACGSCTLPAACNQATP